MWRIEFQRVLGQFRGQLVQRGQAAPADRCTSQFRCGADQVEPGAGIGVVVLAAVLVDGDRLVEVRGADTVGDEVGGLGARHRDAGANDDAGQDRCRRRWPRTARLGTIGGEGAHFAVGHQQVHRQHVVAEAARAVVVLAVDVGADGTADGDLPGTGQHRHPQPERQRSLHQLVEADTGVHVGDGGVTRDGVDGVQRGHVDDDAAAVAGVVAVGAAEAARHDAAAEVGRAVRAGVGHPTDGGRDQLDIGGRQHVRHGG